jgi:hypothetical protein
MAGSCGYLGSWPLLAPGAGPKGHEGASRAQTAPPRGADLRSRPRHGPGAHQREDDARQHQVGGAAGDRPGRRPDGARGAEQRELRERLMRPRPAGRRPSSRALVAPAAARRRQVAVARHARLVGAAGRNNSPGRPGRRARPAGSSARREPRRWHGTPDHPATPDLALALPLRVVERRPRHQPQELAAGVPRIDRQRRKLPDAAPTERHALPSTGEKRDDVTLPTCAPAAAPSPGARSNEAAAGERAAGSARRSSAVRPTGVASILTAHRRRLWPGTVEIGVQADDEVSFSSRRASAHRAVRPEPHSAPAERGHLKAGLGASVMEPIERSPTKPTRIAQQSTRPPGSAARHRRGTRRRPIRELRQQSGARAGDVDGALRQVGLAMWTVLPNLRPFAARTRQRRPEVKVIKPRPAQTRQSRRCSRPR